MITTGMGSWSPLVFLICVAFIAAVVQIIRSLGEGGFRREEDKAEAFFSGGKIPIKNRVTDVYWGFFEAMGRYYGWMKRIHSGIVNDYVYWFVLLVTVMIGLVMLL